MYFPWLVVITLLYAGEDDQKQLTVDDLQEVFSTLINAANDWFELGLALRIKFTTLEGIDPKKKNSDKAHLREMLALWLQSSPFRTWRVLCNALRSETVQQDVLADTIERNQGTVLLPCFSKGCMDWMLMIKRTKLKAWRVTSVLLSLLSNKFYII